MHEWKKIAAVLFIWSLLGGNHVAAADASANPVTATYCDAATSAVYPFSQVTRTDGSTFVCTNVQVTPISGGLRYGFEDENDQDFNDVIIELWISGDNSGAPVAHVRYVSRDADYRHVIYLNIDGSNRQVFDAGSAAVGTVFDIPLPVRACPDFAVSADPAGNTVLAGGSVVYHVSIEALNGFSNSVALSVGGLPDGAGAAFSANPLAAGAATELRISTAAATPAGSYTLTISGTSAGATRGAEVALIVEVPPADFGIEIRPAQRTVSCGQSASYQVRLTAVNRFSAPVTLTSGAAPAGSRLTITPTVLTPDGTAVLLVATGAATTAGTYALTIGASGGGIDHRASATLNVTTPQLSASIDKAFSVSEALPGQEVSFTVTVKNGSPVAFTDVVISDELSPWLHYLGDDAPVRPLQSGQRLEWHLAKLEGGAESSFTVRVTIDAATPAGLLTNVAGLAHESLGAGGTIASAPATLTIRNRQVQLQKSVAQATAAPGDTLHYTLSVKNENDLALPGIRLSDTLDANLEFVSQSGPLAFERHGSQLLWQGDLAAGEQITIVLQARVGADVFANTTVANQAVLTSGLLAQPVESNAVQTLISSEPIQAAQVSFSKRADVPQSEIGRILHFTLTVANRSGSSLRTPAIEDLLPQGFTYVSGSTVINGVPGADASGSRRLTWSLPAVHAGETATLRYQVVIGSDTARGAQVNRAWLHAVDNSGQTLNLEAAAIVSIAADSLVFYSGVEGTVFLDRDGDEFYSPADTPLAGIEIAMSNGRRSTSDAQGQFRFENLFPGEYALAVNRATLPEKYRSDAPVPQLVALADGLTDSVDFSVRFRGDSDSRPARIEGRVFFDKDRDGVCGSGDPLLKDFQAKLDGREQCRGRDGVFLFTQLEPGLHRLEILYSDRIETREITLRKGDNRIDIALRFTGIKITVRGEQ
jgi:uncharacterized repeat protein (TIGR01451 family)